MTPSSQLMESPANPARFTFDLQLELPGVHELGNGPSELGGRIGHCAKGVELTGEIDHMLEFCMALMPEPPIGAQEAARSRSRKPLGKEPVTRAHKLGGHRVDGRWRIEREQSATLASQAFQELKRATYGAPSAERKISRSDSVVASTCMARPCERGERIAPAV